VCERAFDLSTPLHWAASKGNMESVVKLCSLGADILAVCDKERSALRWAAINGHVEVLGKLVDLARQAQTVTSKRDGLGSIFRIAVAGLAPKKEPKKKKDPWAVSLEADQRRAARGSSLGASGDFRGPMTTKVAKRVSTKPPAFLDRLHPKPTKTPTGEGDSGTELTESGGEELHADPDSSPDVLPTSSTHLTPPSPSRPSKLDSTLATNPALTKRRGSKGRRLSVGSSGILGMGSLVAPSSEGLNLSGFIVTG